MAQYRVHIYAIVRVPVEVEADSHKDAIEAAESACDLETLINHPEYEYSDDIDSYLVDELDINSEPIVENARWYTSRGELDPMHTAKSSA